MPFGVRSSGDKWQVFNKETGSVKGTHDSMAEAQAQLQALYANVDDVRTTKSLGHAKPGPKKGGSKG